MTSFDRADFDDCMRHVAGESDPNVRAYWLSEAVAIVRADSSALRHVYEVELTAEDYATRM